MNASLEMACVWDSESAGSAGSAASEEVKEMKRVIDLVESSDDDDSENENESKTNGARGHVPFVADQFSRIVQSSYREIKRAPACGAADDSRSWDSCDDDSQCCNLRSLQFLKNHCWGCHIWIDHPGLPEADNEDGDLCYNALHLHPILKVPICVVCAETIQAVERNQEEKLKQNHNEEQNHDRKIRANEDRGKDNDDGLKHACSCCGEALDDQEQEKDYCLRCKFCPRSVCLNCFEQAHRTTPRRHESDSEQHRKCICCACLDNDAGDNDAGENDNDSDSDSDNDNDKSPENLPAFLWKLQRHTRDLFSSTRTNEKGKKLHFEVLDDLFCLEEEKQKCESILEDPEPIYNEIRDEVETEYNELGNDRFIEIVDERYREDIKGWEDHQTRLLDRISILEDRLKSEYGIEAAGALRHNEARKEKERKDESGHNEDEPLWKLSADKELSKRENEQRLERRREAFLLAKKINDDERYQLEITEDAEELGDEREDDAGTAESDEWKEQDDAYHHGWRNALFKARKEEIESAQEAEDIRRVREGKPELIVRNKATDMKEIHAWDAGLKSTVLGQKTKKKRKKLTTRTISLPTGSGLSEAMFASPARAHQKHDRERTHENKYDTKNENNSRNNKPNKWAVEGSPTDSVEPSEDTRVNVLVGRSKGSQRSSFVLSKNPSICIARAFEKHLKEHQKEGIRFMYGNTFADLGGQKNVEIGGCILAHSMGLGKQERFCRL